MPVERAVFINYEILKSMSVAEFDPSAQIRVLTQALSNRDTPIGFLIGAGCPCSISTATGTPLIPAIDHLSTLICEQLRGTAIKSQLETLEQQYVEDGASRPNIEKLLSRVRTLRDVAGQGSVRGLSAPDLEVLDEAICRGVENVVKVDLPVEESSYSQFARYIREIDRHRPFEIFTTNYDILLEQALERVRAPFFDGFVGAHEPFFDLAAMELDRVPERWTRIWKIHGSINWRFVSDGLIVRSREGTTIPLIFPSHLKYAESRRLPYLAMRDRLRNFIKDRGLLITCGYSFNDEHINEDIVSGLAASPNSVCYALMYPSIADCSPAVMLATRRPNLNVLAQDGGVLRSMIVKWPAETTVDLGDFAGFGQFLVEHVVGEAHGAPV